MNQIPEPTAGRDLLARLDDLKAALRKWESDPEYQYAEAIADAAGFPKGEDWGEKYERLVDHVRSSAAKAALADRLHDKLKLIVDCAGIDVSADPELSEALAAYDAAKNA